MVSHPYFDGIMTFFILINCLFMTIEDPKATPETESDFAKNIMPHIELAFTLIFSFELLSKCIAWVSI